MKKEKERRSSDALAAVEAAENGGPNIGCKLIVKNDAAAIEFVFHLPGPRYMG